MLFMSAVQIAATHPILSSSACSQLIMTASLALIVMPLHKDVMFCGVPLYFQSMLLSAHIKPCKNEKKHNPLWSSFSTGGSKVSMRCGTELKIRDDGKPNQNR